MSNNSVLIEPNSVQETLVLPLYGRSVISRQYPGLFQDKEAEDMVSRLDYDFSRSRMTFYSNLLYGLRQKIMTEGIKAYLEEHPEAVIVNIGAGLDTSFSKVDNGRLTWYNLDLPEVISLREKLLAPSNRERNIAGSAFDYSWMEKVGFSPEKGFYAISGGVFFYFDREKVQSLFLTLAERFPGGGLIFDAATPRGVKVANRMVKKTGNTGAYMTFALKDARKELASWSPHLVNIREQINLFQGLEGASQIPWKYRSFINFSRHFGMMKMVSLGFAPIS